MSQSAPSHSPIEEVAEFFGCGPSRDEIRQFQLSDETQVWISELLDKEDAGTLSAEERHQLDELLVIHDVVTLIQLRVPPDAPTALLRFNEPHRVATRANLQQSGHFPFAGS